MPQQWFAQIDGVTAGPFETVRLRELAAQGKVTTETPVRLGDGPWTHAGKVEGLLDGARTPGDTGSSHQFSIDPSLNDTTEWRMLAETATTPKAEETRPLPRRVSGASVQAGAATPPSRPARQTALVVAAVVAAIGLVAMTALMFVG